MHDWMLFQLTNVEKYCIRGKFLPYKLIGDCEYLIWPFMPLRKMHQSTYNPFKSCVEGLEDYKENYNLIQSSTGMCKECAFGILKGRWRIIMRRVGISYGM